MKYKISFLVIAVIIIAILLAIPLLQTPTAEVIAKQPLEFKVYTAAVCEEKDGKTVCQDRLFYKCGEDIKEVKGDIVCDDIFYNIDEIKLGKGEFTNWTDPRG